MTFYVAIKFFKRFPGFETKTCPFKNLPEARRWTLGGGLTAAECRAAAG